ncbi:MAG: M3 family metallopeptidase [Candidatus Marinimicrobia bacterium]|nr:M3 family metallopeptidase [Candidatus Neomarinimicrobiota bacterium]
MQRIFTVLILITGVLMLTSCTTDESQKAANPFFSDYGTPFETPAFDKIEEEHFLPAIKKGIHVHKQEIKQIVNNSAEPTFKNVIIPLEKSGRLLDRANNVLGNLNSAHTNDKIQEIKKKTTPMLSKHYDEIMLNEKLFEKIKHIYYNQEKYKLGQQDKKVLEEYYEDFVRNGANLPPEKKARLKEINEKLSSLMLQFGENVRKETNKFELVIKDKENLAGLPEGVIDAAREAAEEKDIEDAWVFTIHKPSMIPFLKFSEKRELRKKIFKAYINKGNNNGDLDNKDMIKEMVNLRVEKAHLLGYDNWSQYILENKMAKEPANVYDLLDQVWKPALQTAKEEVVKLEKIAREDNPDFDLKPWDWWYYANKLKEQEYKLDDDQLKPYFKLENVRQGAFDVANKLYGITFEKRDDIPKYHPDVDVFEVRDSDGSLIGIFYTDYYYRDSKRGGAWMNHYRKQFGLINQRPIVCNVCNFSKPTENQPSLLTLDQVETLFHEFGHGLHGLLSDCIYIKLSGTSVPRDFVEMPSQIMENWATHPKVIKSYAKHWETGETIPDELIQKIDKAAKFNQGFKTVEYMAAAYLDMAWHTLEEKKKFDVMEFENAAMDEIGLIPEIVVRYRSPYFQHVFAGGYSSGYYSYLWSAVLDADAFQAFKEEGLYDKATAQSLRENVLEKGGSLEADAMFRKFRGRAPQIDPLLERRGFK